MLASLEDPRAHINIDDVFQSHIGEFGRHQIWLFCLVSVTWAPGALLTLVMTFTGKDPVMEHLWECSNPNDDICRDTFALAEPTQPFCLLKRSQWRWTAPHESVVSTFDLQCADSWKVQLAQSAFFMGFLFGASLWGILSDSLGRRRSLLLSCFLSAAVTFVNAFAPTYSIFFLCRVLSGLVVSGMGLISFVLACELVGPSWRGKAGIGTQFFWATGVCLLPLLAWLVPDWRHLLLLCGASTLIMLPIAPIIPESPRWLLSKGRRSESAAVLQRIADGNKTAMPAQRLALPPASAADATLMDTFRVPVLRTRQFVSLYAWLVVALAYYGVSMALDSLGGSLYLNFFYVSVVEFPAYIVAIALINVWGRRLLTIASFSICGVACVLCAMTPATSTSALSHALRTGLAVAGKFGGAAAFIILYVYTSELFPTVVRNAALGANSSAARIGSVLAPQVVLLSHMLGAPQLPFVTFGAVALVAACLSTMLPETAGKPLPETIEDAVKGVSEPRIPENADAADMSADDEGMPTHAGGESLSWRAHSHGTDLPLTAGPRSESRKRRSWWHWLRGWQPLEEHEHSDT